MVVTYLMDSNVLIDYTSRTFSGSIEKILDAIFDTGFHFSIISKIEVLGFNTSKETLNKLEEFLSLGVEYPLSKEIADACILIRRKSLKVKVPDAIIAATAMAHGHTLLTSNLSDFKSIEGLSIQDPKDLNKTLSDDDLNELIKASI
jgi:predicted nucleic acid-binding protein